jgi:Cytochrome bd terminal oxidase subunit I
MNDLFFARSQMGMSLAFHIIFAVIGMAMPLLMAVSEGCYLWTKKPIFLELSKRWAAATRRSRGEWDRSYWPTAPPRKAEGSSRRTPSRSIRVSYDRSLLFIRGKMVVISNEAAVG